MLLTHHEYASIGFENIGVPQPLVRQIKEWKWSYAYQKFLDSRDGETILVDWSLYNYENFYVYYVYWFENINGKVYRKEKAFFNEKPQKWWNYFACEKDLD